MVYREIIEEEYRGKPTFRNDLLAIEPDARKADELIEGAIFVLSRDPCRGLRLGPYSDVWYFDISGLRPCVLYYTFSASEVLLISIKRQ